MADARAVACGLGTGQNASQEIVFRLDPTIHDAILQQPAPGVAPGTVVGTASRGYRLHDRVVRPAQVIVSRE